MPGISIRVEGRVQGVFFRKYTREKALSLGLTGFVKNQPEGTVYIEAYGNKDSLNALIVWSKTGSPMSSVDNVITKEKKEDGNYTSFEILR